MDEDEQIHHRLFSTQNLGFVLRTLLRLGAPQADVEDLAQDVFVAVHKQAKGFDVSKKVEPWLYGIAKNTMRQYWRKRKIRLDPSRDSTEVGNGTLEPKNERVELLRKSISNLEESLLDVLMLKDLVGMTLSETAAELGIPFDTAKDRLRRARRELKTSIVSMEEEESHG